MAMQRTRSGETAVDKLWRRYLKKRSVEDRNQLAEHYLDLVHAHALRLSRKLPTQVSYDDICSAACDGLLEAVEAYDPKHKAKFETFCQQRIFGAVMDWLRSLDPQSRTVRTFEKSRQRTTEHLDAENGRPANEAELAAGMGLDLDRFNHLSKLSRMGKAVHFSALEARDDGRGNGHPWDVCDHHPNDPSVGLARQMLTEYISRGLTREERLTLVLYYYENLTMAEIGKTLSLSESRVSQMHKSILARLRQRFGPSLAEELAA